MRKSPKTSSPPEDAAPEAEGESEAAQAGEPAAEESFESTPAFVWLQSRAGDFGFEMSYPRGNPHGIDYEPWHWRFGAG